MRACVRGCVRACVRACVRESMRRCVCVFALSRHCLTATVGTVSHVSLSRCSGLSSSIDFGHAISDSLNLAGFEDSCRRPADLCQRQLGVFFVVALASQQRQRVCSIGLWPAVHWLHVACEAYVQTDPAEL